MKNNSDLQAYHQIINNKSKHLRLETINDIEVLKFMWQQVEQAAKDTTQSFIENSKYMVNDSMTALRQHSIDDILMSQDDIQMDNTHSTQHFANM